jgi:hypothetical protein
MKELIKITIELLPVNEFLTVTIVGEGFNNKWR